MYSSIIKLLSYGMLLVIVIFGAYVLLDSNKASTVPTSNSRLAAEKSRDQSSHDGSYKEPAVFVYPSNTPTSRSSTYFNSSLDSRDVLPVSTAKEVSLGISSPPASTNTSVSTPNTSSQVAMSNSEVPVPAPSPTTSPVTPPPAPPDVTSTPTNIPDTTPPPNTPGDTTGAINSPPSSNGQTACWDKNAIYADSENGTPENPRFQILRLASLPVSDHDASYPYYPITEAFGQPGPNFLKTAGPSAYGVQKIAMIWGNRCSPNSLDSSCIGWDTKTYRATFADKITYDFFFTSVAKADACTMAQTLATAGADTETIKSSLAAQGVIFATNETEVKQGMSALATDDDKSRTFGSHLASYQVSKALNSGTWVLNTCYVPEAPGAVISGVGNHIGGIIFDWETADKRSGDETASFIESVTQKVRAINPSLKILMTNDPVVDGTGSWAGITTQSGPRLLAALDGVEIFMQTTHSQSTTLSGIQSNLDAQMKVFNGGELPADHSKFMVQYNLNNSNNLGTTARQILFNNNFRTVVPTQTYIRQTSCDVSHDSDGTGDGVAAHLQELFNLPAPLK